jgi:hypothetical protein
VKRSRKSEIKRSERINVKKFAQTKSTGDKEEEEEEVEEEYEKEEAEE